MPYLRSAPVVGLLILCGCTAGGGLPSGGAALDGTWGGAHVGLALTSAGGTIRYDCAHGTLEGPVVRDREGRFETIGLHVREHGGPVRAGEVLDPEAARYVGQVTGDRMVLQVLVGSDTLGPFTLQRGAEPRLLRCL